MSMRYSITFTGRVQGVFFRATAQQVAQGFAVSGWVHNESDGTVKCVAEGEEAELDRFVTAVRDARRPNVQDVRIDRSAAPKSGWLLHNAGLPACTASTQFLKWA